MPKGHSPVIAMAALAGLVVIDPGMTGLAYADEKHAGLHEQTTTYSPSGRPPAGGVAQQQNYGVSIAQYVEPRGRKASNSGVGDFGAFKPASVSGRLDWLIAPNHSKSRKPRGGDSGLPWKRTPTWWVGYNPTKSVVPVFEAAKSWSSLVERRLAEKGFYIMPTGVGFGIVYRFNWTPDPRVDWKQVIGDPAPYVPSTGKGATATSGK